MKFIFAFLALGTMIIASSAIAKEQNPHKNSLDGTSFSKLSDLHLNNNKEISKHCTHCHSTQRINKDLYEWMKLSRNEYNETISKMITKKIRLMNGQLSRSDGHKIYEYLVGLYNQSHS
jgi:hypothetical protein